MTAWSDLASDVLEHVTSFLALTDLHRFGAVCHNWRSVAKRKRHPPTPQLPWLVLGEDEKTKKRNFFNLSEQRRYSIDIPELYGHFIVSSSFGWLFTVDEKANGYLLNPFTRECFELPPLPPYFHDATMTFNADEAVFDSDGQCFTLSFKELQTTMVSKALLSHDPKENPDFTVIIMFGEIARPAIWRRGDTGWAIIDCLYPLSDVIWFEGNFYIYSFHIMYVVDVVGSIPKATKLFTLKSGNKLSSWSYLMDFKGKLLLMERFKRRKLTVSRVNLKEGALDGPDNIDDLALFVGRNSSLVVDPSGFPGCIPNGIYFTDAYSDTFRPDDFEVYDMIKKAIIKALNSPVNVNDAVSPPEVKPIWFTPNLS